MVVELIVGIIGMLLILIAFILDEFILKNGADSIYYNLLNVFGSTLLIYYAHSLRAWPFLILNLVWFLAAAIKLIKVVQQDY